MRKSVTWAWLVLLVAGAASQAVEQKGDSTQLRTLTGHVFSSENQPVQKAIVYLKDTKTLMVKTYITDTDGSYRFPALSPNVDYEVYADYQGGRSDTKTLSAFDNRKQVTITLRIHAAR
jgi:protocatechuate 3,4-dioxygenase beta subunit